MDLVAVWDRLLEADTRNQMVWAVREAEHNLQEAKKVRLRLVFLVDEVERLPR